MFLTNILLKKAKSKQVLVFIESMVSGHKTVGIRDRTGEKLEEIRFDPYIQMDAVYKETKKIKGIGKK